jgi:hypothetical protein
MRPMKEAGSQEECFTTCQHCFDNHNFELIKYMYFEDRHGKKEWNKVMQG